MESATLSEKLFSLALAGEVCKKQRMMIISIPHHLFHHLLNHRGA
jgi:hypothetical protein